MKKLITFLIITLSISLLARAAEVGVKLNDEDSSQDTTISIKKGTSAETATKKKWIITEGEEDLTGDKDVLAKKAEQNWMKACKEWKVEFKEMNKDNKILSMNCGKMLCSKEGVESTCSSKATHKIKTLSEE